MATPRTPARLANKRHQRHPPGPQSRVETATPHTITPTASTSPGASSTSTRGPHHPSSTKHHSNTTTSDTLTTSDTSSTLRQEWRGENPTTRSHPVSPAPSPSDRHHRHQPGTHHRHQRHRPLTQQPHSPHKRHQPNSQQPEHCRQHSRPTLKNTTESSTVDRKPRHPHKPPGSGSPYPPSTICTTSDTITSTNQNTDDSSLTNNRHPHYRCHPPDTRPTMGATHQGCTLNHTYTQNLQQHQRTPHRRHHPSPEDDDQHQQESQPIAPETTQKPPTPGPTPTSSAYGDPPSVSPTPGKTQTSMN